MSKRNALIFEEEIVINISKYINQSIPTVIPNWMMNIGIQPGSRITNVKHLGKRGGKTDILVSLENSQPIKISAKLSSADYFGNWYSHKRVLEEFGREPFAKLVKATTQWANEWKHNHNASLFVGVSVNFGKRTGNTCIEFTEVFDYQDILKIVAGVGRGEETANCLYIDDVPPININDLFSNLSSLEEKNIYEISKNFKVIFRPVNPMTEGTNRGKCIYTKFEPYIKFDQQKNIISLKELNTLGQYIDVSPNNLNHNRLLNTLENDYNLIIPRKLKIIPTNF